VGILFSEFFEIDCPSSAPTDEPWAVIFFFSSVIGKVLLHPVHNGSNHLDGVQQIIVYALSSFDPAQLVQHSGQLIPQRLVDPGVALDHHIPAEQPTDDAAANIAKAKSIVKDLKLVARSSKTAKKNIKAVLKSDAKVTASIKELKDLGFTVKYRFYRSTKKAVSYKSTVTKKTATYTNTSGKKGTKYFYKVQVRVYDENGKLTAKTALKQCKYASRTWTKAK